MPILTRVGSCPNRTSIPTIRSDLAVKLSKEIRDVHSENWSEDSPEMSDYVDLIKEHGILEHCRSKKYSERYLGKKFPAPDYYDATAEWVVEIHPEVESKTFAKTEG